MITEPTKPCSACQGSVPYYVSTTTRRCVVCDGKGAVPDPIKPLPPMAMSLGVLREILASKPVAALGNESPVSVQHQIGSRVSMGGITDAYRDYLVGRERLWIVSSTHVHGLVETALSCVLDRDLRAAVFALGQARRNPSIGSGYQAAMNRVIDLADALAKETEVVP